jgi:outer membrane protein
MKAFKIIYIACILFYIYPYTLAQSSKGKFLLSGCCSFSGSFGSSVLKSNDGNDRNGKIFNISLTPLVGYFLINGLATGLELQANYKSDIHYTPHTKSISTTVIAGPFVRYYIGNKKIKPYCHFSIAKGKYHNEYDMDDLVTQTNNSSIFAFNIGGGTDIFLNDNVSVNLGLAYNYLSIKAKENNSNNNKDISGQIGLYAGIVIFL